MQLLRFDPAAGRQLTSYGSRGISLNLIDRLEGPVQIAVLHVSPGGKVGRHPAAVRQLFLVVQGEGWVQTGAQTPQRVSPGLAALWEPGEEHAAGSDSGMVAVVLEAGALQPERFLPFEGG